MTSTTTTQTDLPFAEGDEFPPPCRKGEVLADKYVIDALIGMGGMGYVYSAHTRKGNVQVAIKLLHPRLLADTEKTERFLREARATARLSSEHIVRVLDVGKRDFDGLPYLVMEFLAGEDLGEWLERLGPFPTELAIHFVIQACRALSLAHAAGIVHRDIKPSNLILVRQQGGDAVLKLLDFGISKAAEPDLHASGAITHTSAVFGSPTYMSPEQVRSAKNVDNRCDVWALGVVLFELLAGEAPFQGETPGAILAAIVADEPRDLRALRPDLPSKLYDIVSHCLTKPRDQRLGSVDELEARLAPFLNEPSEANSGLALIAGVRNTLRMDSPLQTRDSVRRAAARALAHTPTDLADNEPTIGKTLRLPSPMLDEAAAGGWADPSSNTSVSYSRSVKKRSEEYRNVGILLTGVAMSLLLGIFFFTQLTSVLQAASVGRSEPDVDGHAAPVSLPIASMQTVPCVMPPPSAPVVEPAPPLAPTPAPKSHGGATHKPAGGPRPIR